MMDLEELSEPGFQTPNLHKGEGFGNHNIVHLFAFATFALLLSEDAVSVTASSRIQFEARFRIEFMSNVSDNLKATLSI